MLFHTTTLQLGLEEGILPRRSARCRPRADGLVGYAANGTANPPYIDCVDCAAGTFWPFPDIDCAADAFRHVPDVVADG
jgi:hypothetical protein